MARLNPNKIVPSKLIGDLINAGGNGLQDIAYIGGKAYIPIILGSRIKGGLLLSNKNAKNKKGAKRGTLLNNKGKKHVLVTDPGQVPVTRIKPYRPKITIVDMDYNDPEDDSKRYFYRLDLPFVPREVSYTPDSNFVGIASMGRNTPHYHFTGAEDTLEFTIDWHSNQRDRQDVIFNCRWMEALSKNDAYEGRPHRLSIFWGEDDKLWNNDYWLLTAAPYKLQNFNRGYTDPNTGEFVKTSMLPMQAYQTCTFKRVTVSNRTTKQIIGGVGKPKPKPPNLNNASQPSFGQ